MESKSTVIIAVVAMVAAVGAMTISTNINVFAQTEEPPSREQLQKNCQNGNSMACNAQ